MSEQQQIIKRLDALHEKVDRIESALFYGNGDSVVTKLALLDQAVGEAKESKATRLKVTLALLASGVALLSTFITVLT